ncbi:hypothetical protein [Paraburkholderia caledonica]|uniref:hypothetical protein n=1 Tax=Paraburkholderia caledonica TaxID=134536 RepID=UPI00036D8061|nr:hypothetical protein [Paraburkholderia caledonica]
MSIAKQINARSNACTGPLISVRINIHINERINAFLEVSEAFLRQTGGPVRESPVAQGDESVRMHNEPA